MRLQRHDMVLLQAQTAANITRELLDYHGIDEKKVILSEWYLLLVNGLIPAIIRRGDDLEKSQKGKIPIGISLPFRMEGQRVRFASWIDQQDILRVISPFQISSLPFKTLSNSLATLRQLINQWPVATTGLGIWGANALEILTGLNYTDDKSDVDILINCNEIDKLKKINKLVELLEMQHLCRIDIELTLDNNYGISLKEFFQHSSYVLGKSLTDVILLNKSEIVLN